jgi:hypothetical protein
MLVIADVVSYCAAAAFNVKGGTFCRFIWFGFCIAPAGDGFKGGDLPHLVNDFIGNVFTGSNGHLNLNFVF